MKDLKQLIRESINEYINGINEAGDMAAYTAKMEATQEAIDERKKMISMEGIDEIYHKMFDKNKMKELSSEIKALEKSLTKLQKQKEKLTSKGKKAEETPEEIIDEISLGGNDNEDEGKSMDKAQYDLDPMNESFLYMQKLAGIISEREYNEKIEAVEEAKKMTTAQKDKKEDIVKGMKKSKSFGKSKDEKDKMYATATKLATKKTKSLKEEVEALFEEENISPEQAAKEVSQHIDSLESDPKLKNIADKIANDPKATEELNKMLAKFNISLNEGDVDINPQDVNKMALVFAKKAEKLNEEFDMGGVFWTGLLGGGILAKYIASAGDVITPMMKLLGQSPSHIGATMAGSIAGAALLVIAKMVYDKLKK